jgi:hypothetical protein
VLHADRGPTLLFNGLKDDVVGVPSQGPGFFDDLRSRVEKRGGGGKAYFEFELAPDGSHRPYFITRPAALWLEHHLDFPNWTEAHIRELGETHISSWAAKNGVELEPFYATEEREGGVRALGTAIPGVARETLHVFPEDEWKRQRERFVFETWLRHAQQGIDSAR